MQYFQNYSGFLALGSFQSIKMVLFLKIESQSQHYRRRSHSRSFGNVGKRIIWRSFHLQHDLAQFQVNTSCELRTGLGTLRFGSVRFDLELELAISGA